MRKLIVICILLALTVTSEATIRRVAKDGTGHFTTIQAAINIAQAGDTVVIIGDQGPYSENLTISRRIVMLGEGNGCGATPACQINGGVTLTSAAGDSSSGSIFTGIVISRGGDPLTLAAGIRGITLRRCYLLSTCCSSSCIYLSSTNTGVTVEECILDGNSSCIYTGAASCNISARNTIFCSSSDAINSFDLTTSITLQNCVFLYITSTVLQDAGNWSIDHCIFFDCGTWNGDVSGDFIARYNARQSSMSNFPFDAAVDTTISASPFVSYSTSNHYQFCVSDLHLEASSGLINRGDPNASNDRDGTRRDLGIYGGPTPFVDTGAPDFPFVTQFFVPATVPQNGVLEIRSTGRVGQGVGQ